MRTERTSSSGHQTAALLRSTAKHAAGCLASIGERPVEAVVRAARSVG